MTQIEDRITFLLEGRKISAAKKAVKDKIIKLRNYIRSMSDSYTAQPAANKLMHPGQMLFLNLKSKKAKKESIRREIKRLEERLKTME